MSLLLGPTFTSGACATSEGADSHGERAHLAPNLSLVGGGEHAVAQHDAPIDNHRASVACSHGVREVGHRIVERHQVVLIQIDDHNVGALTRLKGTDQTIEL